MAKNKGGREVRKPKQDKKAKSADTPLEPVRVGPNGKPRSTK